MIGFIKNTNTFSEKVTDYAIPNRHPKLWVLITVVCIISIPLLFFFFTTSNKAVSTKSYTDSLNYVTINVPKNWTTDQENGSNTTGENTPHPSIQQIEISQLYPSAQEGITIQMYKGAPTCPLDQPLTTTLAGFPAAYDASVDTWMIPTTKATVIITISYPGSSKVQHILQQNIATPPPPSVAEQNKEHIMGILKTLKLTNLTPFSC